jgi:hypothetical protein
MFCSGSFLGCFAPVHAQEAQIRSTAHRVLPAALLLLEQFYNIILMLQKEIERIATLRFAQQRKIALNIFLEGCRSS